MKMLRLIRRSLLVLAIGVAVGHTAEAATWRGITPLHSTREDVERILGKPIASLAGHSTFTTDDGVVDVGYSQLASNEARCNPNVPDGTVLTIKLVPRSDQTPAQLNLSISKCDRFNGSRPAYKVVVGYFDSRQGIVFRTIDSFVDKIVFIPTVTDRRRCPDQFRDPRLLVTSSVDPRLPFCSGISASAATVQAGALVQLTGLALPPDGHMLRYDWTATAGTVRGDGINAVFDTTGLAAGEYIVTLFVSDGFGHTFSCPTAIRVLETTR